jgi:hypothetical protein
VNEKKGLGFRGRCPSSIWATTTDLTRFIEIDDSQDQAEKLRDKIQTVCQITTRTRHQTTESAAHERVGGK